LFLADKLTKDMKKEFAGNMYESEKITPIETKEAITIGIPNNRSYSFAKDNSKFLKGDLNNDKKADLIICAYLTEANSQEEKTYFLFLQKENGYEFYREFKAKDIVTETCDKNNFRTGQFNLDSISGGLLIGNSNYREGHEAYFRDYSYRCENEKYKLNVAGQKLDLINQSDLLKKNEQSGEYEKVEVKK
ncbi:MAG TPA: hypothetical protein VI413_09060, partial [Paludibacter sp.]